MIRQYNHARIMSAHDLSQWFGGYRHQVRRRDGEFGGILGRVIVAIPSPEVGRIDVPQVVVNLIDQLVAGIQTAPQRRGIRTSDPLRH